MFNCNYYGYKAMCIRTFTESFIVQGLSGPTAVDNAVKTANYLCERLEAQHEEDEKEWMKRENEAHQKYMDNQSKYE